MTDSFGYDEDKMFEGIRRYKAELCATNAALQKDVRDLEEGNEALRQTITRLTVEAEALYAMLRQIQDETQIPHTRDARNSLYRVTTKDMRKKPVASEQRPPRPTGICGPTDVIERTCQYFCIRRSVLVSDNRERRVSHARYVVVLWLRLHGFAQMRIAKILGMHHTTILHAERRASELQASSDDFRQALSWIDFETFLRSAPKQSEAA